MHINSFNNSPPWYGNEEKSDGDLSSSLQEIPSDLLENLSHPGLGGKVYAIIRGKNPNRKKWDIKQITAQLEADGCRNLISDRIRTAVVQILSTYPDLEWHCKTYKKQEQRVIKRIEESILAKIDTPVGGWTSTSIYREYIKLKTEPVATLHIIKKALGLNPRIRKKYSFRPPCRKRKLTQMSPSAKRTSICSSSLDDRVQKVAQLPSMQKSSHASNPFLPFVLSRA